MGNSKLNCFKNGERPETYKKFPLSTLEINFNNYIKNWKIMLGCTTQAQAINFTYSSEIVHKAFKQINKDITRTYPDAPFFANNMANLDVFNRVLCKIAVYFPRVGYTQGMNFLVGYFLIHGVS